MKYLALQQIVQRILYCAEKLCFLSAETIIIIIIIIKIMVEMAVFNAAGNLK